MTERPETLEMFKSTLRDIADGPMITDYMALTEALLRRLSEKGMTLQEACGPRIMDRSLETLKGHCRTFEIAFPDYTPPSMRVRVVFYKSGDFYLIRGDEAAKVASILGLTLQTEDGKDACGIPAHAFAQARKDMREGGLKPSVGRKSKKVKQEVA